MSQRSYVFANMMVAAQEERDWERVRKAFDIAAEALEKIADGTRGQEACVLIAKSALNRMQGKHEDAEL